MPSWPTVVVGAAVVGGLLGAVQTSDIELSSAAQKPEESPAGSSAATPPDDPASPAGWPPGVRATLPPDAVPQVALTFDDGPDPVWTPQVLDVLDRHDVVATFCVVGDRVTGNERLVRRIHDDGHTLCNHTASHDYGLPARTARQVRDEIASVQAQLATAVPDARIVAFRAPGGRFSPDVVSAADALGLDSWAWSIDPQDWRTRSSDAIVGSVLDAVVPGSVVLLHDSGGDRSATVAALDEILPVLTSAGYELVGLPDLR